MDVTTAVHTRRSVRQFLPDPVEPALLRDLLRAASRAPSGGNVQPWRIYVVSDAAIERLKALVATEPVEKPRYDIYPRGLAEPYRTNRYELGEQLYGLIGIERADKARRTEQMAKNFAFFGAPAAIFCFLDQQMGPPQWSDCGMFLSTFMLLATEAGLATCAQESWAYYAQTVSAFVGAPAHESLFCGVAIGYEDTDAPINALRSTRMSIEDWARFVST